MEFNKLKQAKPSINSEVSRIWGGLIEGFKVYDSLMEMKAQGVKKPRWKIAINLGITKEEY